MRYSKYRQRKAVDACFRQDAYGRGDQQEGIFAPRMPVNAKLSANAVHVHKS